MDFKQYQQQSISNIMGNSNTQESSKDSLPFYSRSDDNYNPLADDNQNACKCGMKTRLMGFALCSILGWFISILSMIGLVIHHNTTQFAILYTLGQITNIVGTCFLATPQTQLKKMGKNSRIWFSIFYVSMIIVTLVLGLALPENLSGLIFISVVFEIIAYFLYTLTYIPGGIKILKKISRKMIQ